jgi:hypothetical protein
MADEREVFPAFRILPSTARAMLAIIERSIGQGTSVKLSKHDMVRDGIPLGSWLASKKRLAQIGFVTVEAGGPNGCARTANKYSLSGRWRDVSAADARRLVKVERRRAPRTVWLLRWLARAAENNAEARALLREHVRKLDAYALARAARERPDLFMKATSGKPRQPHRRSFADDHVARRLQEGARARPGR